MKRVLDLPSAEILAEHVTYDPISGKLFWRERPRCHFKTSGAWLRFNRVLAGQEAGHRHKTQRGDPHAIVIRLFVKGRDSWFLAHRLIFRIMGVEIPEGMEVDHKDCNPWNNAWSNLRIATASQNGANTRPPRVRSSGLPKGVSIQLGRYKAQICVAGKKRHIGMFSTPEAAAAAYAVEAIRAQGEFARLN